MKFSTITDYVNEAISDFKISHAVFTTYNLDLQFFELEVVPLLFPIDQTFSNDARIKELQVCNALESSNIKIDLFYDKRMFETDSSNSYKIFPSMEYGFYAVEHTRGAFHAKIMIFFGTNNIGDEEIRIFSGSNNLTKSGWWDNIESINHIVFSKKYLPSQTIKDTCINVIRYLSSSTMPYDCDDNSALLMIEKYIKDIEVDDNHFNDCFFYFGSGNNNSFPSFLKLYLGNTFKTEQIISPYFPEDNQSKLHEAIGALKSKIFLPVEIKNDLAYALCTANYYEHIKTCGLIWAGFTKSIHEKIEPHSGYRKLHAKLFILESEGTYWCFSGSVNFTKKAFFDNVEAGFLFSISGNFQLIDEYNSTNVIFVNNELLEQPGVEAENLDNEVKVNVYLTFDWKAGRQRLSIFTDDTSISKINLYNHENQLLLQALCIQQRTDILPDNDKLQKHLEKNPYVMVSVNDQIDVKANVFVQQLNWKYKPLNFPELTPQEIIRIYTTMDLKKRDQYLLSATIRGIISQGEETEYTHSIYEIETIKNFFSEYAELFYAFRKLDDEMQSDQSKKEYYLYAKRPDALPALLEQIEKTSSIDYVLKYLILLSAKEIFQKYGSVHQTLQNSLDKIRAVFGDKKFLQWFELEFENHYVKLNT